MQSDKKIKALAMFWRYGYFLLIPICLYLDIKFCRIPPYLLLAIMIMVYGIYTIVIATLSCHHFLCGMQNAYHQKMTPYRYSSDWLRKTKKEGIWIGIIFLGLGLALLVIHIFGW